MERWVPIIGYEGHYEVSDQGRVKSLDKTIVQQDKNGRSYKRTFPGRIRSLGLRPDGYLCVTLSANGKTVTKLVHQIVCEAFNGLRPDGMPHTRHLDGDKTNNRPSNLAWGTAKENMADVVIHGQNYQKRKTHCPAGHEYNSANTDFRPGRVDGFVSRSCKKCNENKRAKIVAWRLENDPSYHPVRTGKCRRGHVLTPENTRFVNSRDGVYGRCRRCMNDRKMESANRKKAVKP